eukprot:TRINITY_DN8200_c0_g1_i1.p1 TRINITY_DN8200_c0_g1~~TRINITY_DN8200_c0_g1_i1.p1  ORF type:complete len:371 (-),score=63.09 TRINITY_DN8200_c0_g1_i1:36-1049(-)
MVMFASLSENARASMSAILIGGGIVGMLALYGVLQEKIMTTHYSGEIFTWSLFLVLCNRVASMTFAVAMATASKESLGSQAPLYCYFIISISNVVASFCQYEALKHVSFTVQMLGKSFKMMPVMVWGMIVAGKKYGLQEWCIAAGVTLGITMFLVTGPTESRNAGSNSLYGMVLLFGFLGADGLTSVIQEKLFKGYQVSKYNQMLYVNLISIAISSFGLISSGSLLPSIAFASRHPAFIIDAGMLSASAVGGQFFIYSMIQQFGALIFALTMNIRQVVSIGLSYATYGHAITGMQGVSLVIVFSALFWKSHASLAASREEAQPLVKSDDAEAPKGTA